MDINDAIEFLGREEVERIFQQEKARILEMFGPQELSKEEQQAEAILRKYLSGYSGVISHASWSGLRKNFAALIVQAFRVGA